jgi:hypothetical protein
VVYSTVGCWCWCRFSPNSNSDNYDATRTRSEASGLPDSAPTNNPPTHPLTSLAARAAVTLFFLPLSIFLRLRVEEFSQAGIASHRIATAGVFFFASDGGTSAAQLRVLYGSWYKLYTVIFFWCAHGGVRRTWSNGVVRMRNSFSSCIAIAIVQYLTPHSLLVQGTTKKRGEARHR